MNVHIVGFLSCATIVFLGWYTKPDIQTYQYQEINIQASNWSELNEVFSKTEQGIIEGCLKDRSTCSRAAIDDLKLVSQLERLHQGK